MFHWSQDLVKTPPACWFAEPISSTLKMEPISSSETSVETQRTTRRHIPENHRCENLKSHIYVMIYGNSTSPLNFIIVSCFIEAKVW
jgi:hypothetical protein